MYGIDMVKATQYITKTNGEKPRSVKSIYNKWILHLAWEIRGTSIFARRRGPFCQVNYIRVNPDILTINGLFFSFLPSKAKNLKWTI